VPLWQLASVVFLHACANVHCVNACVCFEDNKYSQSTRVSQYQKGKTNLDFTEARHSKWQWNPLGHMQVCTSLQTDNHTSFTPFSFLQAGCPSCRQTKVSKH